MINYSPQFPNSLNPTKARIAIFNLLNTSLTRLTADEIYLRINKKVSITIPSVYRILLELENFKLIHRTSYGKEKATYKIINTKISCNKIDLETKKISANTDQEINILLNKIYLLLDDDVVNIELNIYK